MINYQICLFVYLVYFFDDFMVHDHGRCRRRRRRSMLDPHFCVMYGFAAS